MKKILAAIALVALASPALASPAFADDKTPVLTVTGTGEVMVVPDIVTVTLGVTSEARTAEAALAENSKDMATVIAAIKAAGVAEKDIATSGFDVSAVYQQTPQDRPTEQPKIIGYQVANQLRVVIRDLKASGALLDKVISAGANQVNGISFDLADPDKAADEALRNAIAEAKRKAELMADAAGVKLVRIVSLSTDQGPRPVYASFDGGLARKAAPVPIMAGERSVTATATIVWEIAGK